MSSPSHGQGQVTSYEPISSSPSPHPQSHHHDDSHTAHPHHCRHGSRVSINSKFSESSQRSHKEYLDSLVVPTHEMVEHINEVQERKEEEILLKRLGEEQGNLSSQERAKAAAIIQRNYRGHRERRMLAGMSLDPSTRWVEAVKEARYRQLTEPRPRLSLDAGAPNGSGVTPESRTNSNARQNWKKIGMIARRAGGDEDSDHSSSDEDDNTPEQEREARRKRRLEEKAERRKAAKMMDLQYFLEMVDVKHRYGSNLRTYHEEWKKADTKENFFYWLDYGEGRFIDCQGCPRSRLEGEQVRYLSKEERLDYLVKIDKEGRLCWAKNGARIDTTEKYKDSIHGIVPDNDETPAYAPRAAEAASGSDTSSESGDSHHGSEADDESARADKYATPSFDQSKGVKKVRHVSAATIFNKLLRGSVKKNTWIFVADTSFRLYVGIKQSGAFQHSSFLHGSRISAAGLIKIKNGRLAKLSPLSGHYRPPVSNFRAFVHSLKEAGVDMSHVSISRSYAVLVGLEAYVKTRKRSKKFIQKLIHGRDKLLSPDEVAKAEELSKDKSESAARERRFLELKQKADEEDRERNKANVKLMDKLHIRSKTPQHQINVRQENEEQPPGTGPENAIAPEGTRDD